MIASGLQAVPDHPRAFPGGQHVTMDVFHSMWRSRTVPDPWGADTPACETILLHHEQFKISETLARFAVKHGMWGFVKKLASTVPQYVEARRKRVDPNEQVGSERTASRAAAAHYSLWCYAHECGGAQIGCVACGFMG